MARVLAIDDDEHILFVLKQTLESEGHEVIVASDGGEALELLNADPLPDLIVSDLRMDRVDGREFLRRKALDPRISGIPVIVVSGERDTQDLVGFVAAVFEKPYPIECLLEAVEKAVQKP